MQQQGINTLVYILAEESLTAGPPPVSKHVFRRKLIETILQKDPTNCIALIEAGYLCHGVNPGIGNAFDVKFG